eukprot:GFYU01004439.1.p1 GENE.GFYU01004439.1~~GFYU01004439.1.p1  ORF type:complete len:471 (-),score=73.20 GFYU01004439.1:149-1561(-)
MTSVVRRHTRRGCKRLLLGTVASLLCLSLLGHHVTAITVPSLGYFDFERVADWASTDEVIRFGENFDGSDNTDVEWNNLLENSDSVVDLSDGQVIPFEGTANERALGRRLSSVFDELKIGFFWNVLDVEAGSIRSKIVFDISVHAESPQSIQVLEYPISVSRIENIKVYDSRGQRMLYHVIYALSYYYLKFLFNTPIHPGKSDSVTIEYTMKHGLCSMDDRTYFDTPWNYHRTFPSNHQTEFSFNTTMGLPTQHPQPTPCFASSELNVTDSEAYFRGDHFPRGRFCIFWQPKLGNYRSCNPNLSDMVMFMYLTGTIVIVLMFALSLHNCIRRRMQYTRETNYLSFNIYSNAARRRRESSGERMGTTRGERERERERYRMMRAALTMGAMRSDQRESSDDEEAQRPLMLPSSVNIIVITEDLDDNCAICTDPMVAGQSCVELPCNHHFHHSCSFEWLAKRKQCPLDRMNLT